MAEDIFEVDSKGQTTRKTLEQVVETRKSAIIGILNSPDLRDLKYPKVLREDWLDKLKGNLDETLNSAREKRILYALVVQHADAAIDDPEDALFANSFLKAFGAKVTTKAGEQMEVTTDTIPRILKESLVKRSGSAYPNDPDMKHADYVLALTRDEDRITSAGPSPLETADEQLIVGTKIPGVRFVLDGLLISSPSSHARSLRPTLLISLQ